MDEKLKHELCKLILQCKSKEELDEMLSFFVNHFHIFYEQILVRNMYDFLGCSTGFVDLDSKRMID